MQAAFSPKEGTATTMVAPKAIEMYSSDYYTACAVGGVLACGLTHMAVTPLDVVKCNMQANPAKYSSILGGFGTVIREEGALGLLRGWFPTLVSLATPRFSARVQWRNPGRRRGAIHETSAHCIVAAGILRTGCLQVWILRVLQEDIR